MNFIYLSHFTPASFQAKTRQNEIKAKAAKAVNSDVNSSRSPEPKVFVFQPGDKVRYDSSGRKASENGPATVERVHQDNPGDIYYTIKMSTSRIERKTSAKYLAPIVSSPSLNQSTTQSYTLEDINRQIDIIHRFQSDNERINA